MTRLAQVSQASTPFPSVPSAFGPETCRDILSIALAAQLAGKHVSLFFNDDAQGVARCTSSGDLEAAGAFYTITLN